MMLESYENRLLDKNIFRNHILNFTISTILSQLQKLVFGSFKYLPGSIPNVSISN